MLQQTQAAVVIPYYRRFLKRFPSLRALASAELPQVLELWSGLGYYGRARNLHAAARAISPPSVVGFPSTLEGLRALPGFGPYTAAAVGSIAFELPEPAIDGNAIRVYARLLGLRSPRPRAELELRGLVRPLLRIGPPGDVNQAIMDLGQLVCRVRSPICSACPWRSACRALRDGTTDEIPTRLKARPRRKVIELAAKITRGKTILLARRRERGLFGGLWELPAGALDERPACSAQPTRSPAAPASCASRRAATGPRFESRRRPRTSEHRPGPHASESQLDRVRSPGTKACPRANPHGRLPSKLASSHSPRSRSWRSRRRVGSSWLPWACGSLRALMRRVLLLSLAGVLLLAACGGSHAAENARAKARIFAPASDFRSPAPSPLDVKALERSPETQDAILGMSETELAERVGSFRLRAKLHLGFSGAGRAAAVDEERLVEQSKNGDLHLKITEGDGSGMEILSIDGKVYGRSRYGPFVLRDRQSGLADQREEVSGALATLYSLADRGLSFHELGLRQGLHPLWPGARDGPTRS